MTKQEWIEQEFERRLEGLRQAWGFEPDAQAKESLRSMLSKEFDFWEREAKDFVPGRDDGEPPKGMHW